MVYFFFSSRRRHTRYWRDWSSDVCSSDLSLAAVACAVEDDLRNRVRQQQDLRTAVAAPQASAVLLAALPLLALTLGSGIGADPWHVLVATPVGNLPLVVGAALEVTGLTWSSRPVQRALR